MGGGGGGKIGTRDKGGGGGEEEGVEDYRGVGEAIGTLVRLVTESTPARGR